MARIKLLLLLLSVHTTIQNCIIKKSDLDPSYYEEPLYLKRDTLEFIYPLNKTEDYEINIPEETEIVISCGATTLLRKTELSIDNKTILAKCNSESQFEMNGTVFDIDSIGCNNDVLGTETMETVTNTKQTCAKGNGVILKVTYPIDVLQKQVPLYEICFDFETKNVFYSKLISPKLANAKVNYFPRDYASEDDALYYNLSTPLSFIYGQTISKASINQQIGLPDDSPKYFPSNASPLVLIRIGQEKLSDYVFFFSQPQVFSTSRYINTVPIWTINKNVTISNWNSIRNGLRHFLVNNYLELEIYTGTYGITTLPHEDTKLDIELYLYHNGTKVLPLAKLLWRLVYHRETKRAIVLVTVNNPWVVKDDDKICKDISGESGWDHYIDWEKNREDLGFAYACNYEDFKKKVDFLPELEVEELFKVSGAKAVLTAVNIVFMILITIMFR